MFPANLIERSIVKAVILVGGEGTRLRPLTYSVPKPMMPLINEPFITHVFRLLRTHGIGDIILSSRYLADSIEKHFGDGSSMGVSLTYVTESEPLGTAGAVKNVEQYIDGTFVVFNGDILTDLDIQAIVNQHKYSEAIATIALTPVENPIMYGLVETDEADRITRFLEKPSWDQVTTNMINAGTYVLEPEVLDLIPPGENYSFERGVFPTLLEQDKLVFSFKTDAYWMDIGTPEKYILAHHDILEGKIEHHFMGHEIRSGLYVGEGTLIDEKAKVSGPTVIGTNCKIAPHVKISGLTMIGDNCTIGVGAKIDGAVILNGVHIGVDSTVENSIVGVDAVIGDNVIISDSAVIGEGCELGSGNVFRHGIRISPSTKLDAGKIKFS